MNYVINAYFSTGPHNMHTVCFKKTVTGGLICIVAPLRSADSTFARLITQFFHSLCSTVYAANWIGNLNVRKWANEEQMPENETELYHTAHPRQASQSHSSNLDSLFIWFTSKDLDGIRLAEGQGGNRGLRSFIYICRRVFKTVPILLQQASRSVVKAVN